MPKTIQSGIATIDARSMLAPTVFDGLPPAAQAALRAAGRRRDFADGQLIQHRGDDGGGFWVIELGRARVGQFDAHGAFNAVVLLGPGDSFGELAVLAGRPRVVDAVAMGPSTLMFVPAAALDRVLVEDPLALRGIVAALAEELQESLDLLMVLRRSHGAERVARTLATLARDRPGPARIGIGQQELADLVGTSRMTVSTILARLEGQGLVKRGYGWIEVLDGPGLRDTLPD